MNIFVTGGTGFIGSHFVNQALEQGHQVTVLRRKKSSLPKIKWEKQPLWIDKSYLELTKDDFLGIDVLVHLAAHSVTSYPNDSLLNCLEFNLRQPLMMVDIAREAGVSHYIISGTCFEYGITAEKYPNGIPSDASLRPVLPYGASKAVSSIAFYQWAVEKRQRLSYHRIFQVFGEGESENRLWPSLKKAAKAGEDFPMTLGEQIRDFIPVEEVAKRLLDACFEDLEEGVPVIKNLGSGNPQSIRQFAQYWWNFWQAKGELQIGALPYRDHEVFHFTAKD